MRRSPILFVAREPDETLRTFLPIIAELRRREQEAFVLFHHQPGRWALEQLSALVTPVRCVSLPSRPAIGGPSGRGRIGRALSELEQHRRVRQLARQLIREIEPSVVVVIQDTLVLERFLVREANRRGRATIVVQWAFTYPQATYDMLSRIKRGTAASDEHFDVPRGDTYSSRRRGALSILYDLAQRALGVKFTLVRSYGGGEAAIFAVIGEAFREQFIAQGVAKKRIVVTGHPLHDAAFAQRELVTPRRAAGLKLRHGPNRGARMVLYATQPVLWRAVLSREQLVENVLAIGRAVAALGPDFELVIKLHPREAVEDYAPTVRAGLPIRLIKDGEIIELIAPAEVFISSSSSTVLLAMMLDKPIITVNFNQVRHFDYFQAVGGTLHVTSPALVGGALQAALFDDDTRERLAAERDQVVARYARFDGQATRRLADLMLEAVGHS